VTHADALAVLSAWQAPSAAQDRLRREYVAHLRTHPDGVHRTCRPAHLTASTLVLSADGSSVLLTLHAKAGRWFQLGGHLEAGDRTLAGAAAREAEEESGISGLQVDPVPVHLDAHPVPFCGPAGAGGSVHLDVRFLAVAPGGTATEPVVSAESSALRWWPADDLPSDEPSLLALVARARERHVDRVGRVGS
jgi:8-oxo-dGTP pyrophosphatase MutT (NUDIX family)